MLLWYPSIYGPFCMLCSAAKAQSEKTLHREEREPGLSPKVGMGLL